MLESPPSPSFIPLARPTQTTPKENNIPTKTPAKTTDAPGTEVALVGYDQAAIDALNEAQDEELDDEFVTIPLLKIGQPLTKQVSNGDAVAGEFINDDTDEGIGDKVEFIACYYQKGRFASDKETNKAYAAYGSTIPDHWAPLVGEEFVGTPFAEYPDAEEQYKKRANSGEIKWGKGPLVSTTYIFTGFALIEDIESGEVTPTPVRISLQRTGAKAAKSWMQLRKTKLRNKAFFDKTFLLSTEKKVYDKGMAYNLVVEIGRDTTVEEKTGAFELAQLVLQGRVQDKGDQADTPVEPDAKGGLAV